LKAILYYLRIGEYDHATMTRHGINVHDIWLAADYLGIDCLASRTQEILDRWMERDQQGCYSSDDDEE
jgi:hypothetical protein